MKNLYMFIATGMLSITMAYAQYSPLQNRQPVETRVVQYASPLKETLFPATSSFSSDAPLFEFDSLNVSYQGSWGFGQSFSISSNAAGTIDFVGSGAGVYILDVTNPANPVTLAEISARGLVDAIYFDETLSRLYLCAYFAGFEIWDVSNMAAPVRIGGGPTMGLPRGGIFASGNYVYVVTVADGLQVFDVTDPSNPFNTGNCPLDPNNFAWNSAKSGYLIYVALSEGGMKVVDVSDPSNPFVAGTWGYLTAGVWVANGYAYTVDWNIGIRILDVSNLSNITQVGYCQISGLPYRVQVQGNYAYVANATTNAGGGISIVDVSTPSSPQLVNTYAGYAERLAAAGNVLAYTGMTFPCNILDISDPVTPEFAASFLLPVMAVDVAVDGNYAYTGDNGFRVFDISDKTHPVQVGYDSLDGAIVRVAGDNAVYIRESMTANNPVMVMDISDPTDPGFLGQYMAPVMTNDLELRDHYAFVACWWDGVRVVDFQDPAHPVLVAHKMGWVSGGVPGEDYCYVQALDIEGNYLYLIDYGPFSTEDTRGLYILDITDPTNPVFVSRYTGLISGGYDLDAVGNFVYVADMNGGAEVIDVTNKQAPLSRGYISLPDVANGIKVAENHAFVACYINGGVQVVNVTDPDNPFIDGYYTPSGCFALGVNVEGTDIYLADGAGGFQIYNTTLITGIDAQPRPSETSSFVSPNPFTDQVRITVDAMRDAGYGLSVYDASGRLIIVLMPQQEPSGSLIFEWNGKTAAGTIAKPGLYYYHLNGSISGKMLKAK